jgi:alpha-mannosidase
VSVPGAFTVFARGAFEYELTDDGILAITMLRSVEDLSRGDLRERPGHAGWPTATPLARELGAFRVELAVAADTVTPASPAADWAALETLAEEFHAPVAGWTLRSGIEVPEAVRGPELFGVGLVAKAVKPAEREPGLVLRCVNVTGEPVSGAWRLPFRVREARRARLDETTEVAETTEAAETAGTTETIVEILVPPRGIGTIVVIPAA